jgi:ComF family protein
MGRLNIGAALVDLIWPPRSLLSDRLVDRPGMIEAEAWGKLRFLTAPLCAACGFPFEVEVEPGALCGACAGERPAFSMARAALAYDDAAKSLVLELKHGGRRDGLGTFAAWMAQAGNALIAQADVIAPTPLHWRRLASRRFNQSAWLAQALARQTGKPLQLNALNRTRAGRSQEGANAAQRRRNVAGVFKANARANLAGRTLLLIDDVYTTGATAQACARAALKGGAARVHVLTLARVVRPVDVTI